MITEWVDHWCDWLIEFFDIKLPLKNPIPIGFMGRKQAVDFRRTTLETWKLNIPTDHYRIREQDSEIIFKERLKIYYGGLDDREKVNKFNSAEFAFFILDQAEETEREEVGVLRGALRFKYKGKKPPYKQLFSANPDDCWLKEDFIDNPQPNHYFIPALYSDNPHLPENYVDTLTTAFKYNMPLLRAYRDGDWHSLKALNALLSAEEFNELKKVSHHPRERRGVVVCDPSLGGDACIIKVMENHKTIDRLELHDRQPMRIAGEIIVKAKRYGIPNIACDTTGGLGEAILDRIREIEPSWKRIYLSYASKEDYFKNGLNLRSEMAWNYMMAVIDKRIPYPEDEQTRKQILAMRFKVRNSQGNILLEEKSETKKRISQSPDDADAEIMGIWALDNEAKEPIVSKDAWRTERGQTGEVTSSTKSAMAA